MTNFSEMQLYPETFIREHTYLLKTIGYNAIPNFFSQEVCSYLKERLRSAIDQNQPVAGVPRSEQDLYHLHDLLCKDIAFGRTLEDPRLQQLVAPLLGDHWIMYAYTSSSLPPHGKNYGSRLHVDSPRFIANYPTNVGLLWALDDFTVENGATKVLPGSHHGDELPDEDFFERHARQLTCKKGTLLVFNARVWHRAGANGTDSWRHSLTMNVCRSYMKQRMDWVRFIPMEISGQLNHQARRLIGFDTRLPASLEEFFVSDEKRLYKPNQG